MQRFHAQEVPHFQTAAQLAAISGARISCAWKPFRAQLLLQWKKLQAHELDEAGPDRHKIALLIQQRYGIATSLVESYLKSFERTIPLFA